ncbi:MAG TPA: hypothetical protein DCE22_04880, partial [Verrucomicrobiales bacterium]|nr:hypothetical protein [Verrucomicrobiales bacterium]
MNIRTLTALVPVSILAAAMAVSNAQKNKKQSHAEKISANVPKSAPAKPAKARKVLVFSKTAGFRHGSIPTGVEAMKQISKSTGAFEVTATEDDSFFEPEKLKEFDAVIFLNTTGEVFRSKEEGREERLKKSLVDFVKSGKGLIGMHSATDTYKKWKDFNDMMGGAFAGHPWHTKIRVKNLEPNHPLNAAFAGKDFEIADEIYQHHHDIEPLPNGNILVLVWERHPAIQGNDSPYYGGFGKGWQEMGRSNVVNDLNEMWSAAILELEPYVTGINIVWEWHLWDHLIQDVDSSIVNYGIVSEHPELQDINFGNVGSNQGPGGPNADWKHFNALAYNEELDQIAISSRHHGEVYIIDHSTTTEEAAGHNGGNAGKGGD